MERFSMPGEIVDELCARLGVALPTDLDGVGELYRAWSEQIPFDSIGKALARSEGALPPGGDPLDLAEQWLATGLGATCWGHTSTMGAVLEHAGVRCRVGLDRFQADDDRVDLHSFLVVEDGDRRLALDVVHNSGEPLLIQAGERGTRPAYPVDLVEVDGRLLHRYPRTSSAKPETGCYAVLSTDLDAADARTFCEIMRVYGMRVRAISQRRFTATEMLETEPSDDGSALVFRRRSADGTTTRSIADPEEAFAELGYAPAALDIAMQAGLLTRHADGRTTYAVRPRS
jgi:hypothetical protein